MLVIGAGVVGMATARALQRAGCDVAVLDPNPPGAGCSSGNAGVIATEHLLPLARPATLARLPRMLADRDSPLFLKMARVPALAGWITRFLWACRPEQVERGIAATAALTSRALASWQELLAEASASALLRREGLYEVYDDATALDVAARGTDLAARHGVPVEVLDGAALRAREPALAPDLRGALYYPGVAHVLDPERVVGALADAFISAGGRIYRERATGLATHEPRVVVRSGTGELTADYVVLAAGLGSRMLCRSLGFDPPLVAEMGYHVTWPAARDRLTAPVASAAGGFIVTPMADHLRAAGTVEFALGEAEPDWRRAELLARRAARLFAGELPAPATRWRGSRPTLPDFLPAIGPLPGAPRMMAAFGHQHIGLTTAAITGALIRDLVLGVPPMVNCAPYAPGRFGGRRP